MLFINSYYQLIRGKAGHGGNALRKKLGLQAGVGLPGLLGRAGMDSGLVIGGGGVGFRGSQPLCPPHRQSSHHWWERQCLPLILFFSSSILIHSGFSANSSDCNR